MNKQKKKFRILVADDAEGIRSYLANMLEIKGYDVDTVEDGRRALALLEGGAAPDVIILDVMMPGIDGIETLRRIREFDEEVPVVMLSAVGKAGTIVQAMELGAIDYLNKPFEEDELEATLNKVLEKKALERERDDLVTDLNYAPNTLVWASEPMQKIHEILVQIAETDVTVLIQGESGVGKEIVARTAHDVSSRSHNPFVKVNCAALPEQLLESELFGYEKGAFTGAFSRKPGRFELADKGSIFLDEIGEMSPGLQAKLLQVLQDRQFTRLGGNREITVDVRIICSTNRRLEKMVKEGTFREDLFFRLNVVNVSIQPLRERREEIPALVEMFTRRYSQRYNRRYVTLSDQLVRAFETYRFPGNVRELENIIRRVVVLESENSVLEEIGIRGRGVSEIGSQLEQLIEEIDASAGEIPLREVGRMASQEAERATISHVLEHTHWNRKQAARILGVSYKTLMQKIRYCGLDPG